MFETDYQKDMENLRPDESLRMKLADEIKEGSIRSTIPEKPRQKRTMLRRVLSLAACFALILGALSIVPMAKRTTETVAPPPLSPAKPLPAAASYDQLYQLVKANINNQYNGTNAIAGLGMRFGAMEDYATTTDGAAAAPAASASNGSVGFSSTNVQVDGVDEADVVKTDGQYIYVLKQDVNYNNQQVTILQPDGTTVREVSVIHLKFASPDTDTNAAMQATDMYVSGDRLAVMFTYYNYICFNSVNTKTLFPYSIQASTVAIYDISDRTAPRLMDTLGQSGSLNTSRLSGGILYVVTNYAVYSNISDNIDPADPQSFVPSLYDGGSDYACAASDIAIADNTSNSYTTVSAIDVETAARISEKSVMGGAGTVYQNADHMLLAIPVTDSTTTKTPAPDPQYTTVTTSSTVHTDLVRLDLNSGKISVGSQGSIPGTLLNQFAIDEYSGCFRFVTTSGSYSYTWTEDSSGATVNYGAVQPYTPPQQASALYILDANLNRVGGIENIAKGEQLYSVRFDGAVGYFVTYLQRDPLFAVDLSDPKNPTILSALKIPGFSEYLHPFGDGLLLGFGQYTVPVQENGGTYARPTGLKLSMFDVSDPTDVTEKSTLPLPYSYSEAENNHKAVFVSVDKNLVGFPADSGYALYKYEPDIGFSKVLSFSYSSAQYARGLFIGDVFYIVFQDRAVMYDLNTFVQIGYKTLS